MFELTNERAEQILHGETLQTETLATILRAIYTRYMRLYEKFFADIDTLNDDEIAALRAYNEETKSLIKHYYMDIPLDICWELNEFEEKYSAKLLGPDWHEYLFENYEDFRDDNLGMDKSGECLKAEFAEQNLKAFYYEMDSIFRDGFGTSSQTAETVLEKISGLLFKEEP